MENEGLQAPSSFDKYQYGIVTVRDYNGRLKVTYHKALRTKGLECDFSPKGTVNDEKLESNIARSKSRIYELALCNDWDLFFTVTLDPKKFDRNDLPNFREKFTQFIRDYNKKYGLSVKYLLVPEEHAKGGWHMHGFLMGLPVSHLRKFALDEKLPSYIRDKISSGFDVFEWVPYREKFGFNDFEFIRNHSAVSGYVTKYITKDLARTVKESGAHLYYASLGLKRSSEVLRGRLDDVRVSWDFENQYFATKWLSPDFTLEYLKLCIKPYDTLEHLKKQARHDFVECFNRKTGEIYETPFD